MIYFFVNLDFNDSDLFGDVKNYSYNSSFDSVEKIEKTINRINTTQDSMYYCFKNNVNSLKVEEIYFSNENFLHIYKYDLETFLLYDGNHLYREVHNLKCNFIIEEYDNIYENFKLNLENNYEKYECEMINYDESVFRIDNSLTICKDFIDNGIGVIEYEN